MHIMAFKLTLKLKRSNGNNEQVFYKIDGQRFKNERTLKLSSCTDYEMEITVKPRRQLSSFNVQGLELDLKEISTNSHEDPDIDKITYATSWNTNGMPPKKDGERYQIPILAGINDTGEFSTLLQCKIYKESDTEHVTWGQPLHRIDYDCQILPNRTFIDIFKESFR